MEHGVHFFDLVASITKAHPVWLKAGRTFVRSASKIACFRQLSMMTGWWPRSIIRSAARISSSEPQHGYGSIWPRWN